jgi:methionyl-tRNA synthetase
MALALPGRVRDLVGDLRVEQAVEATIALVRRVNRYVAETEPFKVIKTDPAKAAGAVWMALEALRFALNCLWPVMPAKCEALLVAIGAGKPEATLDALAWGGLKPGGAMVLESAPFPRFDVPEYESAPEVAPVAEVAPAAVVAPVAAAEKPASSDEAPARIAFPDFAKVDLRIGTVLVAEPVTGSDKLLRLQVDLGEAQPRQIVAGIGKAYAPADLVGRQIVVVANLEPRKVFGQLSNGMVLAASDDAGPAVLAPARPIPPGTKVS